MQLDYIMTIVTLILLLVAVSIFAVLAARSKNIRSFQFQLSVFILIWIASELVETLHELFLLQLGWIEDYGYFIHIGSMVFIAVMLWVRFQHSRTSLREMLGSEKDAAS